MIDRRTATQATNDRYNRLALHQLVQAGCQNKPPEVLADLRRRIIRLEKGGSDDT